MILTLKADQQLVKYFLTEKSSNLNQTTTETIHLDISSWNLDVHYLEKPVTEHVLDIGFGVIKRPQLFN